MREILKLLHSKTLIRLDLTQIDAKVIYRGNAQLLSWSWDQSTWKAKVMHSRNRTLSKWWQQWAFQLPVHWTLKRLCWNIADPPVLLYAFSLTCPGFLLRSCITPLSLLCINVLYYFPYILWLDISNLDPLSRKYLMNMAILQLNNCCTVM